MSCPEASILGEVARDYPDYLRDESRRVGAAEGVVFPRTEGDVRQVLALMTKRGTPVTVQGARTGIAAGAVPNGGLILNLSRMTEIAGLSPDPRPNAFLLRVQPGVVLSDLRKRLLQREFEDAAWSPESRDALSRQ